MNLAVHTPEWIVWFLGILLVVAAIEDLIRLRISNLLCVGVLILALVAMQISGLRIGLWQNFAVFAGVLAAGTLAFAYDKLGGGDVKLMAALSLWFDLKGALLLLSSIFLVGGVLAALFIASRLFTGSGLKGGNFGRNLPYGIAIAAGGGIALAFSIQNAVHPKLPPLPTIAQRQAALASSPMRSSQASRTSFWSSSIRAPSHSSSSGATW